MVVFLLLVLAAAAAADDDGCSIDDERELGKECCAFLNETEGAEWKHVPHEHMCACAIRHDESIDNVVPYLRWYSCNFDCQPSLFFIFCCMWVLFLFSLIASTADEYMVPNLERLTDMLQLSPNVAGVTLLALGNGAPDFFTSFNSYTSTSRSAIGVGSLLGGGVFITSLVLGSVALVHPFKTNRRPLMRDTSFYLVSVIILSYATAKGHVTAVESSMLVAIYVVYVLVVIFGRMLYQRFSRPSPSARHATHPT